jgi:hypothetical protein
LEIFSGLSDVIDMMAEHGGGMKKYLGYSRQLANDTNEKHITHIHPVREYDVGLPGPISLNREGLKRSIPDIPSMLMYPVVELNERPQERIGKSL